jgi:hypothetical protein
VGHPVYASMQMAGTISVLGQNFIAMDNTRSSKPMKEKVKWLTPGKICEQTVRSNSDLTGNDTMTVDEEKGHEEAGTEPLLKEEWASSKLLYGMLLSTSGTQSHFTRCL